jgi:hypothetical protein
MKEPVPSTYKILADKVLNLSVDERWIDWAIEMIEAGFDSEHLYILAGITKPFNQFELQDLTTKVFNELNLDFSNKDQVIKDYVYYLIAKAIDKPSIFLKTLGEIKSFYIDFEFRDYQDFYLLYFAKCDLLEQDCQFYWDGAFRENIDQVINEKLISWKAQYDIQKTKTLSP